MKVLFATYPMAFHTPGGGEVQLLAYRRHLRARGIGVSLMNPWNPRFRDHDLVHYFSVIGGSSHFCAFVKRVGMPLVVSSSLWITEATKDRYPAGEIRHQLDLADRVVANSDMECDTLAGVLRLPREKFSTVYNGVEAKSLEPASPGNFARRFGIEGPFVLSVANIEERKNQLRLAEAMRLLPGLTLALVGHVRDPAYLEAVLAAGGEAVRYLGPLPHASAAMRSAYADCAVFALPSLLETPGLAALEAAAQGAPLVLTGEGSTSEYFGDTASYVDPMSPVSIADAIGAALAQRETIRNRRRRARLVRSRFQWSRTVRDLVAVYRSCLRH
jgi:glycosyltransferase involved in cell wall biosynthesis